MASVAAKPKAPNTFDKRSAKLGWVAALESVKTQLLNIAGRQSGYVSSLDVANVIAKLKG